MSEIVLPNNWEPRDYQLPAWRYMQNGGKRAVLVWHRRAGKDDIALHWAAQQMFARPGTYWHMLPEYSQGRRAIWEAVNPHTGKRRIDEAFPDSLFPRKLNNTMTVEAKNGAMWHVVGSDNYNSLVGSPPVGVVLSEWALADPTCWAFLSPILIENDGWAMFIYTPRGRNHGHALYERAASSDGWYSEILRADETNAVSASGIEETRKDNIALYGEDIGSMLTEQEFYCSWEGGLPGAYYVRLIANAEREGRITEVSVDPNVPVQTVWDLGKADSTAIWCFQVIGPQVRLVDYIESHGRELDEYAAALDQRGYHGTDWLPHDAKAQILGMKRTRVEQLIDLGRKPRIVTDATIADGINAVRLTLPRCWFDAEKCVRGLDALRNYHRDYDERRKTFLDHPVHDWASHGSDAFRYLAMAWREIAPEASTSVKPINTKLPSVDQLFRDHDRAMADRAEADGYF